MSIRRQRPAGAMRESTRLATRLAGLALVAVLCAGCRGREPKPADAAAPRVEDMSWGPVNVLITADPPKVHFDRDVLITIKVTAPAELTVELPTLDRRAQGFLISGGFERGPTVEGETTTFEKHLRLTPLLADEYRLAPFPVTYRDNSRSPSESGYFATRAITFETVAPAAGAADGDIDVKLKPVWVYPPLKTVAAYAGVALLVVAALMVAVRLLKRVHRHIQLMRMSPRERAMQELAELLAKDLVKKNKVKEFYIELTMVVRRYIERAHGIRAPEQTTEEFLAAVAHDRRFTPATVTRLRAFLQSADLVKFATYQPESGAVDRAATTAREYIQSDAQTAATVAADAKTAEGE